MKSILIKTKRVDLGDEGCHIFCKGIINGEKVRILIDTGASKSVISSALADKLIDLEYVDMPDNETSGIGPEKVVARFARLKKMKIKKLKIRDLIVGVMDVSHVQEMYDRFGHKSFDVILGGDILFEYKALIDYKFNTLLLRFD